jgi:hypothetical protein
VIGGLLSFALHRFGTDLPIMIFIYAILVSALFPACVSPDRFPAGRNQLPRHVRLQVLMDALRHAVASLILVFIVFFPPGLMKSFLTVRTGNAWSICGGYHAVTPHVTVDTRLIVHDFDGK